MNPDLSSIRDQKQECVNNAPIVAMSPEEARRWFVVLKPFGSPQTTNSTTSQTARRTRLVCFPWASSNAMAFRQFAAHVSTFGIEVAALMLPGRSTRLKEPLETNMNVIVDKCFRALTCLGWLDGSVHTVFFGHSFGAIVAFELTRRIERETRQLHQGGAGGAAASDNIVDHLIVSGIPAPHIMQVLFADINNCSHWSEEKLRYVMQADGHPVVDERLVQFSMPILRADCEAFETHAYFGRSWPHRSAGVPAEPESGGEAHDPTQTSLPSFEDCLSGRLVRPEHRVRCPITAMGGARDSMVFPERIRPWVFYSEHGPSHSSLAAQGGESPSIDEPTLRPDTRSESSARPRSHPGASVFFDPFGHHFYLLDPAGGAQWAAQIAMETCLSVMMMKV